MVTVRSESRGDGWVCEVTVDHAGEQTQHMVTVRRADFERWGGGGTVDDLVSRSFDFLLEREPQSSILRTFDLSVIQRYFPEYDATFKR
jgi:hypothetical protein